MKQFFNYVPYEIYSDSVKTIFYILKPQMDKEKMYMLLKLYRCLHYYCGRTLNDCRKLKQYNKMYYVKLLVIDLEIFT